MAHLQNAKTKQDIQKFLDQHGGVAVVDCFATWCGPCKAIAPYVKKKNQQTGIPLITINVQESEQLAAAYKVQAMPTFLVIKEKWMNVVETKAGGGTANVDYFYNLARTLKQ